MDTCGYVTGIPAEPCGKPAVIDVLFNDGGEWKDGDNLPCCLYHYASLEQYGRYSDLCNIKFTILLTVTIDRS